MEVKNTGLMNETVKHYLSGKISYKEAINIMYPIYLADAEELKRIISERKNNK